MFFKQSCNSNKRIIHDFTDLIPSMCTDQQHFFFCYSIWRVNGKVTRALTNSLSTHLSSIIKNRLPVYHRKYQIISKMVNVPINYDKGTGLFYSFTLLKNTGLSS